jgi:hypothetical protein
LSSGAIISSASGGTGTITSVGNGWYRCTVSFTAPSSSLVLAVAVRDLEANWTGNGFGGIYIWGVQLEAGSFATSYIPTVASQVTRSADSATMTGTNFSSWYRADEGTVYGEAGTPNSAGFIVAIANSSGALSNFMFIGKRVATGRAGAGVTSIYGANQADFSAGETMTTTPVKVSLAYKVNDFAIASNGGNLQTDTLGSLPVGVDTLYIGAQTTISATGTINAPIRKIAYYPKRLTNAELQGLTTV